MLNVLSADESEAAVKKITELRPEETRRLKVWLDERIKAGKKKPAAEVVTLTPVLAQLLLDRNPMNRPISRNNAHSLKADMVNKRYELNGETIVLSDTGVLLDGQHRCEMVIETGIAIETFIAFGPKESARFTIDIGKPKTAANFLSMKDRRDTNHLAAAVGYYLQYRKIGKLQYGGGASRPTKTEIIDGADHFKGIDESIAAVSLATKMNLGSRSVLAFCHYAFWKKSTRETADSFVSKLIEGDGLAKKDPILYCRNRLMSMDRGIPAGTRAELVFKCWNMYRRGEAVTKVQLTGGELPKIER